MVISLTLLELSFMLKGGNKLLTVAQPVDYDRDKVIYPISWEQNPTTGQVKFFAEKGREFEPLAAGLGRYILQNDCVYLAEEESGWRYCSVYDERPAVCRDFVVGDQPCRTMRVLRGVDIPGPGSHEAIAQEYRLNLAQMVKDIHQSD